MSSFIIIGGDKRMLYAAETLENCHLCGFSRLIPCAEEIGSDICDYAVLPPQKSSDGINIPCPYSDILVPYSILGKVLRPGGTVFTGNICETLKNVCAENGFRLVNYLEREELAVRNAVLTAEGAVAIVINECSHSVSGAGILITGFGRIAKILAKYFVAMGAEVTVACRKPCDREWAGIYGCKAIDITDKAAFVTAVSAAAIILNTVPAGIIGDGEKTAMRKDALYAELASSDGICGEIPSHIKYIAARGLPGKTAPAAAGAIIADTIFNILSEERRKGYEQ